MNYSQVHALGAWYNFFLFKIPLSPRQWARSRALCIHILTKSHTTHTNTNKHLNT
jgi:hypothetical protein